MSNTPEIELKYQGSEFDEPNSHKSKGSKSTKRSARNLKKTAEQKVEKDPLDDECLMSDKDIKPTKTKTPDGVTTVVASSSEESKDEEVTEEQASEPEDGEANSSSEDDPSSSSDSEEERERKRKKKKKKRSKLAKVKKHKKRKRSDEESSRRKIKKITDDTYENLRDENRVMKKREKIKAKIKEQKKNLEAQTSREKMSCKRNKKRNPTITNDEATTSQESRRKEIDLRNKITERMSVKKVKQETVTGDKHDGQVRQKGDQYNIPKTTNRNPNQSRSPSPTNRSRFIKSGYYPYPYHNQYYGYNNFRQGRFFQRPNQRNQDNWSREGWKGGTFYNKKFKLV